MPPFSTFAFMATHLREGQKAPAFIGVDQDGNKYLEPANPEFENIYPQESLEILGKVV